jgi:Leu/Phe-tRNA-protein transferase
MSFPRYSHCDYSSEYSSIPVYRLEEAILRSIPSFSLQTRLDPEIDLDRFVGQFISNNVGGDFCWSLYFDPPFLVRLMYSGFLPICTQLGDGLYCLLPKLHKARTVLGLDEIFHVSKKVRKHAHKYILSINRDLKGVVEGIHEQHGDSCWLYPPLENGLIDLGTGQYILPGSCSVSVVSVELWSVEDDRLVAGEVGYCVGSIYTSMTGFYRDDGSGSVQLAALGGLLRRLKFTMWDFGMMMEYKKKFGCREIPRREFVNKLREARDDGVVCRSLAEYSEPVNAVELIRELKTS